MKTLVINSSARSEASSTRKIIKQLTDGLVNQGHSVTERDVFDGMPFVTGSWIDAGLSDPEHWSEDTRRARAFSDELVAELQEADTLIIGAPIYNFGVPAVLKAYFDQVCRAGETFSYTASGPVGLLQGKRAVVVLSSGGVPMDSAIDFATPWLRQVLSFIGIVDVEVISAAGQMSNPAIVEEAVSQAQSMGGSWI